MKLKLLMTFMICTIGWANVLRVNVAAPAYTFEEDRLVVCGAAYRNPIGAPALPCRVVTIALPPGAIVEAADFHGVWREVGEVFVPPSEPSLPLSYGTAVEELLEQFRWANELYYHSSQIYPASYGSIISTGGLRKYTLVTVACNHFAYNTIAGMLYCSENITVDIYYTLPPPSSNRTIYWNGLNDDVTFDAIAKDLIYNWNDAQVWYHTDEPNRANGYYIIVPTALQGAVDALVQHRQNQGYDVEIVTKEYIDANVSGIDIQARLRNFLRANVADIEYVLLVGFSTDMPWRNLVPFNNDPNSPYNHPDYSPIPSDLYYAELTDPDSVSWNSDGDSYYGEVYTENFQPMGEDDPDYHADVHLGRIPFSDQNTIEDICAKTIAFDTDNDVGYKTASLLTGAIYYYANENSTGNARRDGAEYCEQLLIDSVLPRASAVTLYEKGGLDPCTLSCTDSLTRSNHVVYWQNKGIMYEAHHGNVPLYARKLWAWDDGDLIPEDPEITWPTSFYITDVYLLDNDHPSTCFLRSCLCGKPEETSLGAMLLYRGGSSVISSSRISWGSLADPGGIPYHFYNRLIQDTVASGGIIGIAYDVARNDFMGNTGFWLPAYHYNLFGDPALRQFGQFVGIAENEIEAPRFVLSVFPNPSRGKIRCSLHSDQERSIDFDVYDVSGRLVRSIRSDASYGHSVYVDISLPSGVYFLICNNGANDFQEKIVITE
ncbi:MAG: T9SS type A sorting domain-containing protein [candidate division WOR-3 bacterium]|nr:MAG: T9SS type A sorting domain-containing protein [candidate division WOR-3 bacterium]